jgi:PAS domain S-box-containing protein
MTNTNTQTETTNNSQDYIYAELESIVNNAKKDGMNRFFELPLDILCIADMHGTFIKVSKSFSQLLGYNEDELTQKPFVDFIYTEDQARTDIRYNELKNTKRPTRFENRYCSKDGSVKWISWHSLTVPEEGLVYCIGHDITELKRVERWQMQHIEELEEMIRQKEESLRYARYLQHAATSDIDSLHKVFPESFTYFSAKEIVSGDFLWMEALPNTKGEKVLVAAADCTGHGVPGAILTFMCSNALNKAVKEFGLTDPGKILDAVCKIVTERFAKSGAEINDGMDISLCLIDRKAKTLKWSGANTPLYIVKNGELRQIDATKKPIGNCDIGNSFVTHDIQLEEGDMIYLFSDGYASQFGGEKGKKFMFSNFKKLLTEISCLNTASQKQILVETIETWKRDLEQVDDILVTGIRI